MSNEELLGWYPMRFCTDVETLMGSFAWNLGSCRIYSSARFKTI
ncbi:hypothetical protein Godav_004397 [Gossypium davidsonii]|uniref:Uncharacterized protein n=2 Tax=Gossypium TaxID=3633 RepID=A0A7J8SLT6_GOSDV|nr:hypothetical protein [Gossypium davidsonii]MBA0662419.1 hypothetical protein [Gossypium klotzschianum]